MGLPGHHARAHCGRKPPKFEVADIFRAWAAAYRDNHVLSPEQRAAMWAIENCRTEVLGGHLDLCPACDFQRPSYNSCRNRHCPKCQSLAQGRWIEGRKARMLPTTHFHVVFTVPSELRPLAMANRRAFFNLLFRTVADTLHEFGDTPHRLGARIGVTAVLHTWTRDLRFHPHVHCIVTGGGLTQDGRAWRKAKSDGKFLFPVKPLAIVFRGKLIEGLRDLHAAGDLRMGGRLAPYAGDRGFEVLLRSIRKKSWVVYAKRPFGSAEYLYEYLGRYTHRVAISNHRIVALEDDVVEFRTRGEDTETLHPLEFIGRFLQHVLPKGFTKIRHYGLYAPGNIHGRLAEARRILEAVQACRPTPTAPPPDAHEPDDTDTDAADWRTQLAAYTGDDLTRCPQCGHQLTLWPLPLFNDLLTEGGAPRAPPGPAMTCAP